MPNVLESFGSTPASSDLPPPFFPADCWPLQRIQPTMTSFPSTTASSNVSEKDIYRIQVSLASMKTSVRVVPTYAKVFVLEERFEVPQQVGQQSGTEQPLPVRHTHEWKLVCTGIPCVLTDRQSPQPTSPFAVKVAVAEAESGLATWDCAVEPSSDYRATQNNFHTFRSVTHLMYGIQFLDETQAQSMFACITELLSSDLHLSRHAGALWYLDREGAEEKEERKKHRSFSVSKKDISKPCNFVHLAGITSKRTKTCEKELTGTMRRMKERSMSLNNLHHEEPQKTTPKVNKKFSFRKSKRKSSKTDSLQVDTPFATQTNGAPIAPTSVHEYSTFRSRSASDVPKGGLTRQPYSTASLGFEPSIDPEIDTMFKKRVELGSQPVKAAVPEYVLQTNSSFRPTASIGGGSSKSVSPTDGPPTTANRTSAPQVPTFSTAAFARGYNPLPSRFAPMYSSTTSLTSEGKPKRRRDSNRTRVSISDSTSNLPSAVPSSYDLEDEDEEESPFLVERYAQQGPETSVEASLVPILDPDEYCNEVGKRGLRATTGAYSYSTYSRNMVKQRDSAQSVLRRPASSTSVNSGPPIRRSSSGQLHGGGVQAARPPSPSNSSHSSGSRKTDTATYPSDSTGPRQSLTDTAQLVSQYTERMSEALQMFDNLVLTGLDSVGNPPPPMRLSSSDVRYGTLSSEV